MTLNESVTKASQGIAFVVSDLEAALREVAVREVNDVRRPVGRSVADRATMAYLCDCLNDARKLQNRLALIAE